MRVLLRTIFVSLTLLAAPVRAYAADPVPQPSFCTVESCDHDPEKLQQFIVSFYKWYIDLFEREVQFGETPADKKIIEKATTSGFRHRFDKISDETNADPILWAQDTPTSWYTDLSITTLKLDKTTAQFELKLGRPPDDVVKLIIRLKLVSNNWRIDDAYDIKSTPFQGR